MATIFGQTVPDADPVALIGARGTTADGTGIEAAAVSVLDTAGNWTATDVEGVLAEVPSRYLAVFAVTNSAYAGGADPTGVADSTAAILAADAACEAAGGGVVYFPPGTYRCDSQLTLATDGGSPVPKFKARTWVGGGSWMSGKSVNSAPNGGSIIDMRNASNPGLFLNAEGHLGLSGLTFTQLGTAHTQPMILVTNTTAHIDACAFYGHTTKSTTTCNQDAIVFGGTTTSIGSAATAPFQGYGSYVRNCHFNRIKRGVWGRMYANAIKVQDNTWWAQCGGATALEFDGGGDSINYNIGGTITGNLIECVGYTRAMTLDYVSNFYIAGNDFYDNAAISGAYISIGAQAQYNTIIAGHYVSATSLVSQVNRNTIIDMNQSQTTTFTEPVALTSDSGSSVSNLTAVGAPSGVPIKIQPTASGSDARTLLQVKRSAAEATNPGTTVLDLMQRGELTLGGANAGRIIMLDAAGTEVARFDNSLGTWKRSGVGGAMEINSGTGGSYCDMKHYGVRYYDHTGTLQMTYGAGGANLNAASGQTLDLKTNGTSRIAMNGTGIGFFAATPAAKPTVTGSRGGNAALASLLTELATLGLLTDSSTA